MSISTRACYDFPVHNPRKSPRKATSQNFFGGAAVACMVVGCAWTVYANVCGAVFYPAVSGANCDVPDVDRLPPAVRRSFEVADTTILIEQGPAVSAPK